MLSDSGERGWVEGEGAPEGWRAATADEASAFDAEDARADLASGLSGVAGLGEIALNAATAGAYGGDLERQRAVAVESPVLTGIAEAVPGFAAETALAVGTGGLGLAATGAIGAASAAAAGRARALRNEQDYGLADLAQDGAIGGVAGPLVGKALGLAGAAAGRGVKAVTGRLVDSALETAGSKAGAEVLERAGALGLKQRGLAGLEAVSEHAGRAAKEAAAAEAELMAAAVRGPALSKLVGGRLSGEGLEVAHTGLRAALAGAPAELADDAARAAAALRDGGSTREAVGRISKLAAKARALGAEDAAQGIESVLSNPLVVGERAAGVARVRAAAYRGDATALRGALDDVPGHRAVGARKAADEAARRAAEWSELAPVAERLVSSGLGKVGRAASTAADPALGGLIGAAGGWAAVGAVQGSARAVRALVDLSVDSTARRLFETGTKAAGSAIGSGLAAAGRGAGAVARRAASVADSGDDAAKFEQRRAAIEAVSADPNRFVLELGQAVDQAPEAEAVTAPVLAALGELKRTMPVSAGSLRRPMGGVAVREDVRRWNRAYDAVTDPLGAVEGLATGATTPAAWRALESAHPQLAARVREGIVAGLREGKRLPERRAAYIDAVLGTRTSVPLAPMAAMPSQPTAAPAGGSAGAAAAPSGLPRALGT